MTSSHLNWFVISTDGEYSVKSDIGKFVLSRNELVSINEKSNEIPTKYYMSQNYPNPFNPSTSIKFSIPNNDDVKLAIYNIHGQKIALLVNGELKAGNYEINWNANQFASGLYLYQIKSGEFIQTKKMLLVK